MAGMSILRVLSDIVEPRNPNYQIKFQHLQFNPRTRLKNPGLCRGFLKLLVND